MKKLGLSSPWITYWHEIEELFGHDPEISVVYEEDEKTVKLYVRNSAKAEALTQLLPPEKTFGNVKLKIEVVPANVGEMKIGELYEVAFKDNPVFSYVSGGDNIMTEDMTYVVFRNRVVQFFNDNLNDINGNTSTLYENIARDVFEDVVEPGTCFCTDTEQIVGVGMPLGEWP